MAPSREILAIGTFRDILGHPAFVWRLGLTAMERRPAEHRWDLAAGRYVIRFQLTGRGWGASTGKCQ